MSVTYQELCSKFTDVKACKTASEQLMLKEVELLFSASKASLSMPVHSYTKILNRYEEVENR
jgi:hypothetical protein